jgi:hypothetical protein
MFFNCGGRKAISCDVLEQADEQRSFPAVHFIMCIYTKRREHRKKSKKKNHRHSPFSTVHYIMLVLGIAFSI